jgi:hypothetical protein
MKTRRWVSRAYRDQSGLEDWNCEPPRGSMQLGQLADGIGLGGRLDNAESLLQGEV